MRLLSSLYLIQTTLWIPDSETKYGQFLYTTVFASLELCNQQTKTALRFQATIKKCPSGKETTCTCKRAAINKNIHIPNEPLSYATHTREVIYLSADRAGGWRGENVSTEEPKKREGRVLAAKSLVRALEGSKYPRPSAAYLQSHPVPHSSSKTRQNQK